MSDYIPSSDVISRVMRDLQQRSRSEVYYENPVAWAEEVLGATLWSAQKEILMSLAQNKRTAVKSCHMIGKTYVLGIAATWWAVTRGSQSLVVTTAPNASQVSSGAWNEIRKQWQRHDLPGYVTAKDSWNLEHTRDDGKIAIEEIGFGRSPAKGAAQGVFQGLHRENGVLFLIDEACSVEDSIFVSAEVNTTAPQDRILAVANPDDPATAFGRIFLEEDPTWHTMSVSAYATPNFTGEINQLPVGMSKYFPNKQWVDDMRIQWGGEDSARFKAKILAEFPSSADWMFYTQRGIDKAVEANENLEKTGKPVLGMDVAYKDGDYTVIYANWGGYTRQVGKWNDADLVESQIRARDLAWKLGATEIRIDTVGIGQGVFDLFVRDMRECARNGDDYGFDVIEMIGSEKSTNKNRWANARAERHDWLRMKMLAGEIAIDPEDKELIDEMLSQRYEHTDRGAIQMESKRAMRSRGAKSPDSLDAMIYACADMTHLDEPPTGKQFIDADEYLDDNYGDSVLDALVW